MEKLKVKHDHKLTDILKVFILGLFLIMPFLVFAPSLLYISFNQNAVAEETTINVDEYRQVNFNQLIKNGNFENTNYWRESNATLTIDQNGAVVLASNYFGFIAQDHNNIYLNHKYYLHIDVSTSVVNYSLNGGFQFASSNGEINYPLTSQTSYVWNTIETILTSTNNGLDIGFYIWDTRENNRDSIYLDNLYLIDLTQMFGAGNEPTIGQINQWYTEEYYDYTLSKPEVLKIGTNTETIKDVETQIANNWQQMWNKQIFKWTNETILYKGINAFSQTFGIFDNSYITNLITYELIIVMIYIVIDIILTMFKWLTHMIGEK